MKRFQRFDFGSLRRGPKRTSQGFLRLDANVTRVGVLTYHRADGTEFRELRLPEEVFRQDSLDSLAGAPVTDLHPREMVTPANVTSHQKGHVGHSVKHDQRFVTAPIIVQDEALIKAVESGARRELSPGYTCQVELTAGEWRGQRHDGIQRNILYNHMAVGPIGWGRSGSDVAFKLDSHTENEAAIEWRADGTALAHFVTDQLSLKNKTMQDLAAAVGRDEFELSFMLDGFEPVRERDLAPVAEFLGQPSRALFELVPVADRARGDGGNTRRKPMETVQIKIDGITYEVPVSAAPHIEKALAERDKKAQEATARADAAEAKVAAATKAVDETQAKLDEASSPEKFAGRVRARVALERRAAELLPDDTKLDGLSDRELRLEAIKASDPEFKEDDKSDDYLAARFDVLEPAQARTDAAAAARAGTAQAAQAARTTSVKTDAASARAKMNERSRDAWKQPLIASKS